MVSRSPSQALEGLQFSTSTMMKRGASMAIPKGLPLVPQEEVDKLASDADWVSKHAGINIHKAEALP